jgi:hypothetical protein
LASAVSEVVLDRRRLGTVERLLGAGGQARVYAIPMLKLPDASGPFVYKEYKTDGISAHGLRSLVAKRARLDLPSRDRLDRLAVWPLRVVEEHGAVRGVVLRLIPDSFFQERLLPGTGTVSRDPCEVQNLFLDPALAARLGMPLPTPAQRLTICRDFAAAVHFVHRLGLVVGDLNARNALFRLGQRPNVVLLDCDAVRVRGSAPVVPQLHAPDWDPPEGKLPQTQQTDQYKFGLFVLRCLAPGRLGSVSRDPARADAALDVEGRRLLRDALWGRPEERPTIQEWGRYFSARTEGRPTKSVPRHAEASPVAVPPQTVPVVAGGRRRDAAGVWRPVP